MPIIPDFALAVVKPYLAQLLVWLSDPTYLTLLKRDRDHLLIQLTEHLNFTRNRVRRLSSSQRLRNNADASRAAPRARLARQVSLQLVAARSRMAHSL